METLALWILVLALPGLFAAQVGTRVRLIAAAPNSFSVDQLGFRVRRFLIDVVGQRRTIVERPVTGLAHALVFWGFVAFAGYTTVEFLYGLGIVDVTRPRAFEAYRLALIPFSALVLAGIVPLMIRRAVVRPAALGETVSVESIVIGLFIVTLMATFLLSFSLPADGLAGRGDWGGHAPWVLRLVILGFLASVPGLKPLPLVVSPIHVVPQSADLGTVPNLDFEKEEV